MISCSLFEVLFGRCNIWIKNAPWLPRTGTACNTLKLTFVHLTYYSSCQQLPDATNPPKKIMTLRHMYSTGAPHMVGSNEQHVQGCSMRQTDVYCFTEWVVCLCAASSVQTAIPSFMLSLKNEKCIVVVRMKVYFAPRPFRRNLEGLFFFENILGTNKTYCAKIWDVYVLIFAYII